MHSSRRITITRIILPQVAKKALPFYKDYFGIAYPLPKMDLIAVADFSYGGLSDKLGCVLSGSMRLISKFSQVAELLGI